MTTRIIKKTPPRLKQLFPSYESPLYFVTIKTWQREKTLNTSQVHEAFVTYAKVNSEHGRCIGRYTIMPDHIHFFVRLNHEAHLNDFVRFLKQNLGNALDSTEASKPHWQPGFFDHLLRHCESYAEKWEYVRQNPVRAGLVEKPEDWPYQGETVRLEY